MPVTLYPGVVVISSHKTTQAERCFLQCSFASCALLLVFLRIARWIVNVCYVLTKSTFSTEGDVGIPLGPSTLSTPTFVIEARKENPVWSQMNTFCKVRLLLPLGWEGATLLFLCEEPFRLASVYLTSHFFAHSFLGKSTVATIVRCFKLS